MTNRSFSRKNRNGLDVGDLHALVRDAAGMSPYVKLKGRTKMNGTLIELTIEEPESEPVAVLPPYATDSTTPLDGTAHPIDSRRATPYFAPPND